MLKSLIQIQRNALIILFLGLLLRVAFIVFHERPLISDERDYHQLATNILTTGTYGYNGQPSAYRPVAYPLLMSAVYLVTGQRPLAVKLFQALLDICIALLLYQILKKNSERYAVLALTLWSFYIPAILYTNFLLTETLFTFFLILACWYMSQKDLAQAHHALAAGCLLGVLTLLKPAMLFFVLAMVPVLYFAQVPLKQYKFIVAGAVLILAPWIWRNYHTLGKATIGTNGGINLLIGNNPNTTGAYVVNFPEEILQHASNEVEADELAYRYGIGYIKAHPSQLIINGFKKIAHLFSSEGGLLVWSFHDNPEDLSERYALKYSSLPFRLILLANIPYAFLLLVGMLGFVAARQDLLWWIFFGLLSCWLATHFIFFGGSRFHFPLMPLFALFAAPVLPDISGVLRTLSPIKKIMLGVLFLGFLSIWTAEALTITRALTIF